MVLYLQPKLNKMAKFKFKGTTTKDVEEELNRLSSLDANEIPLNHIIKVVSVIGVSFVPGETKGSMVRFQHPDVETYGHYFGVHKVHKGKSEDIVLKRNFKQYMLPFLYKIVESRKKMGI